MPEIRAVLFDLDGTLRDSREAINPAIQHALGVHGIVADPAEIAKHVHSLAAVHEVFAAESVSYHELEQVYDEKVRQRLELIQLYDHVPETLSILREQGLSLALVSSARRAREALVNDGLIDYFDAVIGGYDTTELKPHPEPVELALGQLACLPEHAVMVGDLEADILAGRAAGLACNIGLTHGFGARDVLEAAGADYTVDSLEELPDIIKRVQADL